MVEGHSCHRLAHQHRKRLVGKKFEATSPNGSFSGGAGKIDGKTLVRIEVHGKNLFYFFEGSLVIHIHFGMSGRFSVHSFEKCPLPHTKTRLRLENVEDNIVAQLSAMTLSLYDEAWYGQKIDELGPDPLREDADKERLWAKWKNTSRAIGLLLMDQSAIAGIGNIFRAEILFKAGVHPEQPATTIARDGFERVWLQCVGCLQAGFKYGSICTFDPEEAKSLGAAWQRRYIYNQAACGRCGSTVLSWMMAARRAYCCPTCQGFLPGTNLSEHRRQVLKKAAGAHLFPSSCAKDTLCTASLLPGKLHLSDLRALAKARGLDVRGTRKALLTRLNTHATTHGSAQSGWGNRLRRHAQFRWAHHHGVASEKQRAGTMHLVSATSTPVEAVLEKLAVGEKRSVEHVAEMDDAVTATLSQEKHKIHKIWDRKSGPRMRVPFSTPLKNTRKEKRVSSMISFGEANNRTCFSSLRSSPQRTNPIFL